MKAILEFELPLETEDFNVHSDAFHYLFTLKDLDNHLRSKLKYETLTEAEYKVYQEVRDKLHAIASEHDVSI